MTIAITLLVFGVVCYAALCVYLYYKQAALVFYPTRELTADPLTIGIPFEPLRLQTTDHIELAAWFAPADSSRSLRGVALVCHGNGGNISHRLQLLRALHNAGLAVLLFDYRGYGESAGAPSEEGIYRDAGAAWDYLTTQRGVDPSRIVIVGESLGGAVAAQLAKSKNPGALILMSTFTTAADLGAHYYPYLPVRLLSRYDFNTIESVRHIHCPLLIVHSPEDEIVPFSQGESNFQAAAEPKTLLRISGDHNDGFMTSGALFTDGLQLFLTQSLDTSAS